MMHLTEDELYALCLESGGAGNEHLRECRKCAAQFEELKGLLELTALDAARVPEPGADYGDQVWRAIQGSLPLYRRSRWQPKLGWHLWTGVRPGRLVLAGALAGLALVATAFWAGRVWEQQRRSLAPESAQAKPGGSGSANRVVFVVVREHLDRSERLLIELDHAGHLTEVDRGPLAREASDLLEDNRLYRQTAAAASDPALARLLDRLGRVLVEVAHDPGTIEGDGAQKIQEQKNLDGLLFELRVLRDREGEKETKL